MTTTLTPSPGYWAGYSRQQRRFWWQVGREKATYPEIRDKEKDQ